MMRALKGASILMLSLLTCVICGELEVIARGALVSDMLA